MLSEQQRDNEKTCFVKGWDVTPKQNAGGQNSTTKWLTIQHHSWISFSGSICALPNIFDLLSIWGCSGDNIVDDIIFHKLSSLLAHHHLVSILENFATIQMNSPRPPLWYSHLLSGLYHLGNNGCMGFDGVRTTSLGITDAGRQTWVAEVCQS
jgi:hypothetical protein